MTTTIDLLRARPKACEKLGLLVDDLRGLVHLDEGNYFLYGWPPTDRLVAGSALLWLAERDAYPQRYGGGWDVAKSGRCMVSDILVEGRDDPLVAMLDAIEGWEE